MKALAERTTVAGGEIGPTLYARRDLTRWAASVKKMENIVALPEGIAARRPGTRFVLELKTESQKGTLVPFRYSGSDSYMLCFNGGKMRVLKDGGFLQLAGVPFELSIPYVEADLPNLRWSQDFDTLYIAGGVTLQPRQLQRLGHTSWTIGNFVNKNGPVEAQNSNPAITINASAVTGNGITLTGSGTAWNNTLIGGIFRLDEPTLLSIPLWQPGEKLISIETVISGASTIGNMTNGLGLAQAFDGGHVQTIANCAQLNVGATKSAWIGQDFFAPGVTVSRIAICGSSDQGYMKDGSGDLNPQITIELWGKVAPAVPINEYDGVKLGEINFTDTSNESNPRIVYSSDPLTLFQHLWVRLIAGADNVHIAVAELDFMQWLPWRKVLYRRWNGRVYEALTDGETGLNPPTHDEGDEKSGGDNIIWRFLHSTYGFVRVTAVASANSLTADVLTRLPASVVTGYTMRWSAPSWSPGAGWPEKVQLHQNRIMWFRKDRGWGSRPADFTNYELNEFLSSPDEALAFRLLSPDGSLVWIEWALASGVLVLGARDAEWMLRGANALDALTIKNMLPLPDGTEGSAPHIPALVDSGAIYIGRSRKRLHFVKFDRLADQLDPTELTRYSRHILRSKAAGLCWQRDPNRLLWVYCQDGALAGITFDVKEKTLAPHRHPMTNGIVEDCKSIVSSDESVTEVYMIVQRTINGAVRRYVEQLAPFFEPLDPNAPTAELAWFVDCGLQFSTAAARAVTGATKANPVVVTAVAHGYVNGDKIKHQNIGGMVQLNGAIFTVANKTADTYELSGIDGTGFAAYTSGGTVRKLVSSVSGFTHLEAQTVAVFVDGREQTRKVVAAGIVTLDAPGSDVLCGIPIKAVLEKLPDDLNTAAGTTKGEFKKANRVLLDVLEAAGGKCSVNGGELQEIFEYGGAGMNAPLALVTGPRRVTVASSNELELITRVECDNALPMTIAGVSPFLEVDQGQQ